MVHPNETRQSDELLDKESAAKMIGCTKGKLSQLRFRELAPKHFRLAERPGYRRSDVLEFLSAPVVNGSRFRRQYQPNAAAAD